MYFDEPAPRFDPAPLEINLVAAMMGFFVLGFVFIAHPLLVMAQAAAQSLF
jgi:NADH-quinone oxidoreductase subunit N